LKENPIKDWKLGQALKNEGTTQEKDHPDGGSQKIGQTNNQPFIEKQPQARKKAQQVD